MNQITTLLLLFALSIIVVVAVVPIVNEIAYYQAGVLATSSNDLQALSHHRGNGNAGANNLVSQVQGSGNAHH